MSITISCENGTPYVESEFSGRGVPAKLTELESEIATPIVNAITSEFPDMLNGLMFDRRASQYLTLSYMERNDFLRIKASSRVMWFSMWVDRNNREDKRLEMVQNKRLSHWKIVLKNSKEIQKYIDLICSAAEIAKTNEENYK